MIYLPKQSQLTFCYMSPHTPQMREYQYNDYIFELLLKRRFQRIPTGYIYHWQLVNSFPRRALAAGGTPRKAVDSDWKV